MRKDAVDVIELRARHRLLRLSDHHIIAHASFEALPLLRQRLPCYVQILLRDLHLACGGLQIQVRITHLALHLALLIFQFGLSLAQGRVSFFDIPFGSSAAPDRHRKFCYCRKCSVGLPGIGSDYPVIRAHRK